MKIKGWDLDFFNTGEWQVCDERLKTLEKINRPVNDGYSPGRAKLFEALRSTPFESVRVCLVGQDPYPSGRFATGVAFSIPGDIGQSEWPPTLKTFLGEYVSDLRLDVPHSGDLGRWTQNGVLLWNAYPSCAAGQSLSHDWPEWELLTKEIVTKLSKKGIVFALLGQVARRYIGDISVTNNAVVVTSHPSPRGSRSSKTPYIGSRIFSTINDHLNNLALEPMDWKL